jgi:protein-S-isoprenylcysteine O-methyltransferase Ste14
MIDLLARVRVPLGFVLSAVVLVLARPTPQGMFVGAIVATLGEAIRVWASGHLEKSREVTRSGPYRFTRHPLYLGSSIMGAGLAIASQSEVVALIILAYIVLTIGAAIRREEAFLRRTFGTAYDEYASGRVDVHRRFSLERAMRNREYRAVLGLSIAFLLLFVRAAMLRG